MNIKDRYPLNIERRMKLENRVNQYSQIKKEYESINCVTQWNSGRRTGKRIYGKSSFDDRDDTYTLLERSQKLKAKLKRENQQYKRELAELGLAVESKL